MEGGTTVLAPLGAADGGGGTTILAPSGAVDMGVSTILGPAGEGKTQF